MRKHRKKFQCGHQGYGQICHRCLQEESIKQENIIPEQKANYKSWRDSFAGDSIDLNSLPAYVVLKSRNIIKGLQDCQSYREFHGKRLRHDRLVISIPVTRNYRMLCIDRDGTFQPQQVISHQAYNVCKPGS
jgi:hypothetical protein